MKQDPRYAQWLEIADELVALSEFVYGPDGPWSAGNDNDVHITKTQATVKWIRDKCAKGWWYWWDKTTIAGEADWPLRTMYRLMSEGGYSYQDPEVREMLAKIKHIEERIEAACKS